MAQLTNQQVKALRQAMRGKWDGSVSTLTLRNLSRMGHISGGRPTNSGLEALLDYERRRWGKDGCHAYLLNMDEVEAALASQGVPA